MHATKKGSSRAQRGSVIGWHLNLFTAMIYLLVYAPACAPAMAITVKSLILTMQWPDIFTGNGGK